MVRGSRDGRNQESQLCGLIELWTDYRLDIITRGVPIITSTSRFLSFSRLGFFARKIMLGYDR
jgi:hypothetical protein